MNSASHEVHHLQPYTMQSGTLQPWRTCPLKGCPRLSTRRPIPLRQVQQVEHRLHLGVNSQGSHVTSLECSPHNASCQLPCTMPVKACNLASNPVSRCPMAPMPLRYHCLFHYLRPRRDMEVLQSCLMPQPFTGFGTAEKTCKHKCSSNPAALTTPLVAVAP